MFQIHRISKIDEVVLPDEFHSKGDALALANELNDKPVDGTIHVVRERDKAQEIAELATELLTLVSEIDADSLDGSQAFTNSVNDVAVSLRSVVYQLKLVKDFRTAEHANRDLGWGGQ